jgi:hypothetical protein
MKQLQLVLSIEDTNLILEALGALPFARVYQLIGKIQEHARTQLDAADLAARANAPSGNERAAEHERA